MKMYPVGGWVRDRILGVPSKDIDYAVEVDSYDAMLEGLVELGFKIHQPDPEHLTVRCGIPADHPAAKYAKDADFVVCRRESSESDGRRPDSVEPGTLEEDLLRRDFTVNAMAIDLETDTYIDIVGGLNDLQNRTLRFVGDPMDRIREDGLRVVRGLRFMITKGLEPEPETWKALISPFATEKVLDPSVARDRIASELERMFQFDTRATLDLICHNISVELLDALFKDGTWLRPTNAKK